MTDPTSQTTGGLLSLFNLDWNGPNWVTVDGIIYGPKDDPGPAWIPDTDYYAIQPNALVPPFGAVDNVSGTGLAGYAALFEVRDMSTATVAAGKSYAIAIDVGSEWIQLYFILTGSQQGTTVMPGFGFYNLTSKPDDWTYVTPAHFTGQYETELLTPVADVPVWLSVAYAPLRDYGNSGYGPHSKLIFTCSGGTATETFWGPSLQAAGTTPRRATSGAVGMQYLQNSSAPYDIRDRGGSLLKAG